MTGSVRYAVFDVGNVLIGWNPRFLYSKLIADPERLEHFMAHVWDGAVNLEMDRGLPFAEGIAQLVARHPDWENEIRAFDERWDETVSGEIGSNVSVLSELQSRGVPCYSITNFSAEKYAASRKRFPFLDTFDGLIVSAHERLVKPDPAIYQRLLDRYGLTAVEGVFIDDSEMNVRAAEALGFHTVHVRPDTDLRAALATLGLLR